uniref:Uncharacterized protein n=1 Tax=viral metagenome TaxID=1070528 RepID=A0A6C0BF49_9ZZZZ
MFESRKLTDDQFIYVLLLIFIINFFVNFCVPSPNLYKTNRDTRFTLNKFYTVFANSSLVSILALFFLALFRHIGNEEKKEDFKSWTNIIVFTLCTASYIIFAVCASEQLGINDINFKRAVEEHNAIIIRMAGEKKHVRNISENDKQKYQRIIDINTYDVLPTNIPSKLSNLPPNPPSTPSVPSYQSNPPPPPSTPSVPSKSFNPPSKPFNPPSKPFNPPSKPSITYNPSKPSSKPFIPSYPSKPSYPSNPSNEMSNNSPSYPTNPTYPSNEMSNNPPSYPTNPTYPSNEMSNNPSNPTYPTYPSNEMSNNSPSNPSDEMSNGPSANPPDPNEPHNNPSLEHMTMLFV